MLARRLLGATLFLAATITPAAPMAAQEDHQRTECVTTTTTTTEYKHYTDGSSTTVAVSVSTTVCRPI
jgi:hypothetical protein